MVLVALHLRHGIVERASSRSGSIIRVYTRRIVLAGTILGGR